MCCGLQHARRIQLSSPKSAPFEFSTSIFKEMLQQKCATICSIFGQNIQLFIDIIFRFNFQSIIFKVPVKHRNALGSSSPKPILTEFRFYYKASCIGGCSMQGASSCLRQNCVLWVTIPYLIMMCDILLAQRVTRATHARQNHLLKNYPSVSWEQ